LKWVEPSDKNSPSSVNKQLMTGPKANSEFCFPRTSRVEEKQNSLFPKGRVIKCFVIPPASKIKKKAKK